MNVKVKDFKVRPTIVFDLVKIFERLHEVDIRNFKPNDYEENHTSICDHRETHEEHDTTDTESAPSPVLTSANITLRLSEIVRKILFAFVYVFKLQTVDWRL